MMYSGLYTALVTPFKDGNIDTATFEQLIELQNEADGVVIFGATGESITLNLEEKLTLLKIARKKVQKRLVVGVGTASTQMTIELSKLAEFEGADALLVVTPYYNKPTQEGIYRHFEALAKATTLPIIVYNVMTRSGVAIEVATLKKLSEIPNIVATKDCSKNLSEIEEIVTTIKGKRPDFALLSGDDSLTFPIMSLGGDGIISTASNLFPKKMKQLVEALQRQNYEMARKLHYELTPIFKALFIETNPIPVKAALNHLGWDVGDPRLPLTPLSAEKKRELISVLESYK